MNNRHPAPTPAHTIAARDFGRILLASAAPCSRPAVTAPRPGTDPSRIASVLSAAAHPFAPAQPLRLAT